MDHPIAKCPCCNASYAILVGDVGRRAKCKKCGTVFVLQTQDEVYGIAPPSDQVDSPSHAAVPPQDAGTAGDPSEAEEQTARAGHQKTCPSCGHPWPPDAVVCLSCGFNTTTGEQLRTNMETLPNAQRPPRAAPRRCVEPDSKNRQHATATTGHDGDVVQEQCGWGRCITGCVVAMVLFVAGMIALGALITTSAKAIDSLRLGGAAIEVLFLTLVPLLIIPMRLLSGACPVCAPFAELRFLLIIPMRLLSGAPRNVPALISPALASGACAIILAGQLTGSFEVALGPSRIAERLTHSLFSLDGPGGAWGAIICGAVVPAVCEEVFFRGLLLRTLLLRMSLGWAVFVSSFVFSLIHLQLAGAIPIFLLGVVLALIAYHTGTLWLCILVHALNNILAFYLYNFSNSAPCTMDFLSTPLLGMSVIALILSLTWLCWKAEGQHVGSSQRGAGPLSGRRIWQRTDPVSLMGLAGALGTVALAIMLAHGRGLIGTSVDAKADFFAWRATKGRWVTAWMHERRTRHVPRRTPRRLRWLYRSPRHHPHWTTLVGLRGERAEVFREVMQDSRSEARLAALETVGKGTIDIEHDTHFFHTLDLILEALQDESPSVGAQATLLLERIVDTSTRRFPGLFSSGHGRHWMQEALGSAAPDARKLGETILLTLLASAREAEAASELLADSTPERREILLGRMQDDIQRYRQTLIDSENLRGTIAGCINESPALRSRTLRLLATLANSTEQPDLAPIFEDPATLRALLMTLGDEDVTLRTAAQKVLETTVGLTGDGANSLVRVLQLGSPEIRGIALRAVRESFSPVPGRTAPLPVIQAILQCLAESPSDLRRDAVLLLSTATEVLHDSDMIAAFKSPTARAGLLETLLHEPAAVVKVLGHLVDLRNQGAVNFAEFMEDPRPEVRQAALEAMRNRVGTKAPTTSVAPPVMEILTRAATDQSAAIRTMTVLLFGDLAGGTTSSVASPASDGIDSPPVSYLASFAFGEARATLFDALMDDRTDVNAAARMILSHISALTGDGATVFLELSQDTRPEVRSANLAVQRTRTTGEELDDLKCTPAAHMPVFSAILSSFRDSDSRVRIEAVALLGELGYLLEEPAYFEAFRAFDALPELVATAAGREVVASQAAQQVLRHFVEQLSVFSTDDGDELAGLLADSNSQTRYVTLSTLREHMPTEVLSRIPNAAGEHRQFLEEAIRSIADPDQRVRAEALWLVASMLVDANADPSRVHDFDGVFALPPVKAGILEGQTDASPDIRSAAWQLLTHVFGLTGRWDQDVPTLLKDPSATVRRSALVWATDQVSQLGESDDAELSSSELAALLVPMAAFADDESSDVRNQVIALLGAMKWRALRELCSQEEFATIIESTDILRWVVVALDHSSVQVAEGARKLQTELAMPRAGGTAANLLRQLDHGDPEARAGVLHWLREASLLGELLEYASAVPDEWLPVIAAIVERVADETPSHEEAVLLLGRFAWYTQHQEWVSMLTHPRVVSVFAKPSVGTFLIYATDSERQDVSDAARDVLRLLIAHGAQSRWEAITALLSQPDRYVQVRTLEFLGGGTLNSKVGIRRGWSLEESLPLLESVVHCFADESTAVRDEALRAFRPVNNFRRRGVFESSEFIALFEYSGVIRGLVEAQRSGESDVQGLAAQLLNGLQVSPEGRDLVSRHLPQ